MAFSRFYGRNGCSLKQLGLAHGDCEGPFKSAHSLGIADSLVPHPLSGPPQWRTLKVKRILLGINRVNPLICLTSAEAKGFLVCRGHQELCKDAEKTSKKNQKCTLCDRSADRVANMKLSVAMTIKLESSVTFGSWICRNCAAVSMGDAEAQDFMDFILEEDRLCNVPADGEDPVSDMESEDIPPPSGDDEDGAPQQGAVGGVGGLDYSSGEEDEPSSQPQPSTQGSQECYCSHIFFNARGPLVTSNKVTLI